jgi:PRC-barrel domain
MSEPVSWFLIEPGWEVVADDGSQVGKVHEVIGDTGDDIFDGLAVSSGLLGQPRYVAAERVKAITEGTVALDLGPGDAEQLEPYEEPPPSEQILPVTASWSERLRGWFRR